MAKKKTTGSSRGIMGKNPPLRKPTKMTHAKGVSNHTLNPLWKPIKTTHAKGLKPKKN